MTLDMKSTKNTLYAMVIKESVSVGKFADDSVCVCVCVCLRENSIFILKKAPWGKPERASYATSCELIKSARMDYHQQFCWKHVEQ